MLGDIWSWVQNNPACTDPELLDAISTIRVAAGTDVVDRIQHRDRDDPQRGGGCGEVAPRHGRIHPSFSEYLRGSGKSLEHHLDSVIAQIRSCGGLAVGGSWDAVLRLASDPESLRQHLRQSVPRLDALSWTA